MRSRLSYYSVLVLVGLGIVSALILAMNPFNSAPATASPASQSAATASVGSGNAPPVSNSPSVSSPAGNGLPPGGGFDGEHHDSNGFRGEDGAGNSTTTTTATAGIYSQNE